MMNRVPRLRFFVSGAPDEVRPGSPLWERPLLGEKSGVGGLVPQKQTNRTSVIGIGDYFSAAGRALTRNRSSMLMKGLESGSGGGPSVSPANIRDICFFLEKHGAFYHPLKIKIDFHDGPPSLFVLNGAVSQAGLALIEKEFHLISHLNQTAVPAYLPQVYGVDIMESAGGRIGFLLGEWFDGYREFHVSQGPDGLRIVLWDSDGSCQYISEARAMPIYSTIARILTDFYDIETCRQIYPWHHAAGDFVVRPGQGKLWDVRLITARGYPALSLMDESDAETQRHILPSLLFFFFNLTLRMRLDRLDGIGPMVMMGENVLRQTVEGFLASLDAKTERYDYGDLKSTFGALINRFDSDQMSRIGAQVATSLDTSPEENRLIRDNLEPHCRVLKTIFKTM